MGKCDFYEKAIPELIKALTLEEKAQLVSGGGIYTSKAIDRLGIPSAVFLDACCGVNLRQYLEYLYDTGIIVDNTPKEENGTEGIATMARFGNMAENITSTENLEERDRALLEECMDYIESLIGEKAFPSCFPSNTLLAATWNREAVYENACAVGREASAYGVDVLLGTPCINIQRDGRGGRCFENYSEDPYLAGELGASFARGVSEQGIVANAKHFAANNQETERMRVDEIIPERALHEIYFPAFKSCIQKGGVKTIMSAYNWINGKPCAQNEWLLKKVLRKEWGFDGCVVSDWRAAYNLLDAVKAGNNLAMPGPRDAKEIQRAVEQGEITEEELDKRVEEFLRVLKEMPVSRGRRYKTIDFQASAHRAYETALEGITLLKNQRNTLPLSEDNQIAIFGQGALKFIESGTGSGHVFTDKTTSLLSCMENIAGASSISYGRFQENTDTAVVVVSTEGQEGGDKGNIQLKPKDLKLLEQVVRYSREKDIKVVLLLNVSGPVEMAEFIENIDACLNVYYPGQEGAAAAADLLYGKANPCGKLPHTFPKYYWDTPSFGNFPGYNEKVYYGEGIYVGYRWYDTRKILPMFPFGYGLSYTTFVIGEMEINKNVFYCGCQDKIQVSVAVENTGDRWGKEVVQLYIKDVASTLDRPEKELKGFEKIALAPGEKKRVTFEVTEEDLSFFDTKFHRWVCEPGEFKILIGNSSDNIVAEALFAAKGENPYGYGSNTSIIKISMDERAVAVILKYMGSYITETEFYNIAYFGQRHSLEVVWETMLSKVVKASWEEKKEIYKKIQEDLAMLDVSKANLREKFVF